MTNILNDPNLVEHWNLNESSGNRSGVLSAYTFTSSNGVGQDSSGKVDQAAAFVAASSQSLNSADLVSSIFDTRFGSGTAYTVSLWAKVSDTGIYYLISTGVADDFYIASNAGALVVYAYSFIATTGSETLTPGTWHHIAVSVSPTGSSTANIILIFDGSTVYNGATSGEVGGSVWSEFRLGGQEVDTPTLYLNGSIDHVSLFDRALSLSELGELYNGGSPPEYAVAASGVPGKSNVRVGLGLGL